LFLFGRLKVRKHLIHAKLYHIINHPWKVHLEESRTLFYARVGVHFDHPDIEVLVDDEVIAKHLKARPPLVRVHDLPCCIDAPSDQALYFRDYVVSDRNLMVVVG